MPARWTDWVVSEAGFIRYPLDTQMQSLWLPSIQAQLALDKKKTAAAQLQAASPIELAGVYCELREQACKQIFVRELEALRRITHVGYYEAMAARPRVLTKACWARDCCEST
jgi:hypothetical protein